VFGQVSCFDPNQNIEISHKQKVCIDKSTEASLSAGDGLCTKIAFDSDGKKKPVEGLDFLMDRFNTFVSLLVGGSTGADDFDEDQRILYLNALGCSDAKKGETAGELKEVCKDQLPQLEIKDVPNDTFQVEFKNVPKCFKIFSNSGTNLAEGSSSLFIPQLILDKDFEDKNRPLFLGKGRSHIFTSKLENQLRHGRSTDIVFDKCMDKTMTRLSKATTKGKRSDQVISEIEREPHRISISGFNNSKEVLTGGNGFSAETSNIRTNIKKQIAEKGTNKVCVKKEHLKTMEKVPLKLFSYQFIDGAIDSCEIVGASGDSSRVNSLIPGIYEIQNQLEEGSDNYIALTQKDSTLVKLNFAPGKPRGENFCSTSKNPSEIFGKNNGDKPSIYSLLGGYENKGSSYQKLEAFNDNLKESTVVAKNKIKEILVIPDDNAQEEYTKIRKSLGLTGGSDSPEKIKGIAMELSLIGGEKFDNLSKDLWESYKVVNYLEANSTLPSDIEEYENFEDIFSQYNDNLKDKSEFVTCQNVSELYSQGTRMVKPFNAPARCLFSPDRIKSYMLSLFGANHGNSFSKLEKDLLEDINQKRKRESLPEIPENVEVGDLNYSIFADSNMYLTDNEDEKINAFIKAREQLAFIENDKVLKERFNNDLCIEDNGATYTFDTKYKTAKPNSSSGGDLELGQYRLAYEQGTTSALISNLSGFSQIGQSRYPLSLKTNMLSSDYLSRYSGNYVNFTNDLSRFYNNYDQDWNNIFSNKFDTNSFMNNSQSPYQSQFSLFGNPQESFRLGDILNIFRKEE
jgi:hypothetical protein